ncbi:MAG: 3D-(3,5/4)-trihydroxycyclohexane-1,2-dione acylhydrolase (decyclizing) [Solirubrobacteraceae bacterium]
MLNERYTAENVPEKPVGPNDRVRLTAGQATIRYLAAQWSERDGVRRRVIPAMCGIFGHGNVCGIGQALEQDDGAMPYYQAKNEQAMVHMAIGFAKVNDRLSTLACSASIGPGATNMVTGAATATVNRVPVLLLPSDTFANRLQGPPMQALDDPAIGDLTVNDCFRPVSRFFDRVSRPEQLLTTLPEAIRTLLDPERTGAVTVSLHQDVQAEAYNFPAAFFVERTWQIARRPSAHADLALAAAVLRDARQPLIIAGGGVHYSGAREALAALSDRFGVPVAETSAGKGAMPGGRFAVGAIGHSGTRAANALAEVADVVVCVGTRLIDLTTGSHSLFQHPDVRFVAVNVSSADAHKLGATPIVADARLALEALIEALQQAKWSASEDWRSQVGDAQQRWRADLAQDLAVRDGQRMTQGQALHTLNRAARSEDMLVVASGTPHVDIHKIWDTGQGARVLMEVGFSCMGHEIPAGIGARLGAPAAGEIFVVIGDGTYLMGHSELVTALQEGLKITVLLLENHGFQSIHALQRSRIGRSFGLEFRSREQDSQRLTGPYIPIDLAANAASYGCAVFQADTVEQLAVALEAARRQPRSAVIVARVEPHRLTLDSRCWWDVGVAETSTREETNAAFAEHARGRLLQRYYG